MYYFILPNFYRLIIINNYFSYLSETQPNIFNFECKINGQDGNFPYFYWNGGTNLNNYHQFTTYQNLQNLQLDSSANKIVLDCSNPLLTSNNLLDSVQNTLLSLHENGSNEIIVTNPDILLQLKEKYPAYNYIGSPFYYLYDTNFSHIALLHRIRCFSNDLSKYTNISKRLLELSVITPCPNCLNAQSCQLQEWTNILNFKEQSEFSFCSKNKYKILTLQELTEFYKIGIRNFYFDFRSIPFISIDEIENIYLSIFIQPKYQQEIKIKLLKEFHYYE